MTREEAKEELIQSLTNNHIPDPEAVEMAIKALEQEPCDDAISRAETVKFLANHSNDFEDVKMRMAFQAASSLVNNPHNLPSVTLQPKTGHWIFDDECKEHGHCSQCGYGSVDLVDGEPHNYCPKCGEKLIIEPQESEDKE